MRCVCRLLLLPFYIIFDIYRNDNILQELINDDSDYIRLISYDIKIGYLSFFSTYEIAVFIEENMKITTLSKYIGLDIVIAEK